MARPRPNQPPARWRYRAHWSVFLPALIICLLYVGIWLLLLAFGRGDTGLARLALLVAALGGPLLLVHAYLRYHSLGLVIGQTELRYRRGWLRPRWRRVPYGEIVTAVADRSPVARLSDAGALTLILRDGERIRLDDIVQPKAAARQINQCLMPQDLAGLATR